MVIPPLSPVHGSEKRLENATDEQRSILLRAYLQAQVARTLRVAPEKVDVERPIVDLGLDSLMGIELATIIEQDCAITLPSLATSREITVNRLVRDILQHMGYTNHHERSATKQASMETAAPSRLITPLRAGGSKPPLICFHPIGGSIRGYKPLTDALDGGIPVFGVQSRMLFGEEEYSSLEEMAASYTNEVQTLFPEGPLWLFGYSLGGYLAARVAQNLEAAGRVLEFIGVADCPDWTVGTTGETIDLLAKLIASSYHEAMADLPFLKPLDDWDWSSLRPIAEKLAERPDHGPATLLGVVDRRTSCVHGAATDPSGIPGAHGPALITREHIGHDANRRWAAVRLAGFPRNHCWNRRLAQAGQSAGPQ